MFNKYNLILLGKAILNVVMYTVILYIATLVAMYVVMPVMKFTSITGNIPIYAEISAFGMTYLVTIILVVMASSGGIRKGK